MKACLLKFIFIIIQMLFFFFSRAQTDGVRGRVEDATTHGILSGVSITIFESSTVLGGISNPEGDFSVHAAGSVDSVKFSMIGYHNKVFKTAEISSGALIIVRLEPAPSELQEVTVHPVSALDIVRQAAQKIQPMIPSKAFESKAFYREIIRDSLRYYSVAEALFSIQFSAEKKSYKLKLDKGRSKEDVAYTRLFEDYHPGGGPEDAVAQSFVFRRPDFLNEHNFKNYIYKKDSTILRDDQIIYVIGFDQKPDLKEALEKGKIYIDASDFSVLKFEAENSPAGTPYIKSLKGTDKIFAELLHIDLTLKKWARKVNFEKIGNKLFLSHVKMDYEIDYKQSKKSLDLDLSINTELLVTDFKHPVTNEISKGEEWKRRNLVANLPADFDSSYWGTNNIVSPDSELNNIIASISNRNQDLPDTVKLDGWNYFNREYFLALEKGDSIKLIPLVKCAWGDRETGGMIYKNIKTDFNMEARLFITKRSNSSLVPDIGFQQAGFIVRNATGKGENNLILSMGTGGNELAKYFLRKTNDGNTTGQVGKTDSLTGWLRIEKHGNRITAFRRPDEKSGWIKIDEYSLDWLTGELQVGFSVMARFVGDGPKHHPDMKAIFSNIKIDSP